MKVKVSYQTTEQNADNQPVLVVKEDIIPVKSDFKLKEITDVITGEKKDSNGNNIQGVLIGDSHYYRTIDITNISVEK